MDYEDSKPNLLEQMLLDANAEPTYLPLSLLKAITNNFSDDQKIGSGGFAVVYKGVLRNGTVAVKKISQEFDIDQKSFMREVSNMETVKHNNIVRFLGYSADTQEKVKKHAGKAIMLAEQHRLLCFEFMPKGGLDKYISGASKGLDWRTRYQIIKGICMGLDYLHRSRIVHLDLKPANILLDRYMVPKIADFGLSKSFENNQTRAMTSVLYGSLGYIAPELFDGDDRVITFKADIYSLGRIIIEILTGRKGFPETENVLENWKTRFKMEGGAWLEQIKLAWLEQIKLCTEIGIQCIDHNPRKRHTIRVIVEKLREIDSRYGFVETEPHASSPRHIRPIGSSAKSNVVDIHPLELRFALEPNKRMECTLTLTNTTDGYVGVSIAPTEHIVPLLFREDVVGDYFLKMEPHSSVAVGLFMRRQPHRRCKFEVLIAAMGSKESLVKLLSSSVCRRKLDKNGEQELKELVESLNGRVHQKKLTAVLCDPASSQEAGISRVHMVAAVSELGSVLCIDVHPTQTWVLVGHQGGHVSIWNYQTQEKVMMVLKVNGTSDTYGRCGIWSAKFIPREQWFAVGDYTGWVHVYAYTTGQKIKEFKAHNDDRNTLLAVHPTDSILLTSSSADEDDSIKLWDWSQSWVCTQEFKGHTGAVYHLTFDPRNTGTFASFTRSPQRAEFQVWNIGRSRSMMMEMEVSQRPCYFFPDTHGRRFLLTSARRGSRSYAMIRDLQTQELVHQLAMVGASVLDIACHPTLPIVATTTIQEHDQSYQIRLWDATTYRLEKIIQLPERPVRNVVFTGTEDFARIFVPVEKGISIMEINLSNLKMDLFTVDGI